MEKRLFNDYHERKGATTMLDELKSVINTNPRSIPVILLLDCSGSMHGPKIEALNNAVNVMLDRFAREADSDTSIKTAIIAFGGADAKVIREFGAPSKDEKIKLSADGMTPLGCALNLAKDHIIEDREVIASRDYRPTVILVSDGMPNDDWESALDKFIHDGRSSKCFRWALSIGVDRGTPAYQMLKKFVSDEEFIFDTSSAAGLYRFFQRVTVSVVTRTRTMNPNKMASPEEEQALESCIGYPVDDDDIPF